MLTKIILIILSLILIGFLANLSGKLAEKLKLPSLIGMILIGMIIGPSFLNLVVTSDNPLVTYINKSCIFASSGLFPHTPNLVHPLHPAVSWHWKQNIDSFITFYWFVYLLLYT